MNDFYLELPGEKPGGSQTLLIATISAWSASLGATLTFDGQQTATTKRYRRLVNGQTPAVGDRVLVAKMSGTYIILGKIGF